MKVLNHVDTCNALDCAEERLEKIAYIAFDIIEKCGDNPYSLLHEIAENEVTNLTEKIWMALKLGGWIETSMFKIYKLQKIQNEKRGVNDEYRCN
jgi:hypothetical protein